MERVFDDLIGLQRAGPLRTWRRAATAWTIRIACNLMTGIAIGVGIAVGLALAG